MLPDEPKPTTPPGIVAGPWVTQYRCADCESVLSYDEVMMSHGTCPLCGAMTDSTIVECETYSTRTLRQEIRPWWQFWRGPRFVEETEYRANRHGTVEAAWEYAQGRHVCTSQEVD